MSKIAPADNKTTKFQRYAWMALLTFGIAYMFFYNGRQNINLVLTQMAEDLNLTTAKMGIVTSALFWCYAFGQLVCGRLGEYLGHKRFVVVGISASAVINVVISFQHNVGVIAALWGLNGFFQSMVWANGMGVVNKWWPKERRGFSTGLATFFSGIAQVTTYLSVLLCLQLNPEWGWRAAFRFPIIPMALALIPFILCFKSSPSAVGLSELEKEEDPSEHALAEKVQGKGYFYPYKLLFSEPKVILFCLIAAIAGIGQYGLLTWIPTYFTEHLGFDISNGLFSAILLPAGQASAMFIFPIVSDKFFKGKREPILIVASIITFCGMLIFPFVKNQLAASLILFLLGVFSMVTGVIWTIAGDIGGKALSATVIGVFDWAVYMGAATQAVLFGFMKDLFGWSSIFVVTGALYVLLLALTLFARKLKTKNI